MIKILVLLGVVLTSFPAIADVDVTITFIVDTSGSITDQQLMMERDAVHSALNSIRVRKAVDNNFHQKIALQFIQFSDNAQIIIDWTELSANQLSTWANLIPQQRTNSGNTNLLSAIKLAYNQLIIRKFDANKHTVIMITDDTPNLIKDTRAYCDQLKLEAPKTVVFSAVYMIFNYKRLEDQFIEQFDKYYTFGYNRSIAKFSVEAIEKMIVNAIELETQ